MLRNMATSLFVHERIRTTDTRAKELRRVAERIITLGKRGDLHARRRAASVVRDPQATRKLFSELADRYREIPGGYVRIVKLGPRRGDGAPLSLVELVTPAKAAGRGRKKGKGSTPKRRATPRASGRGKETAKTGAGTGSH
jgi:large subunit ribosomal protein L17